MSAVCVPTSSIAFNSSGANITYWSFANSYPLTISSRGTTTSSLMQMYCCFRREPHALCSMLNEIDLLASVAEKSLTGIETNPNETVKLAMDRAAIVVSVCEALRRAKAQSLLDILLARQGVSPAISSLG